MNNDAVRNEQGRYDLDDDFLTAAILNWDDGIPTSTPPEPRSHSMHINLFVVLSVLYALAALVLGVRWYQRKGGSCTRSRGMKW